MKQKWISLALATMSALCLVGCGDKKEDGDGDNLPTGEIVYPTYTYDEEVLLSAYMTPLNSTKAELYDWAADAGLNQLYVSYTTNNNPSIMKGAMEQCERAGITFVPMTCWGRGDSFRSYTQYPWLDEIQEGTYSKFGGFNILDEPFYEDMDMLAEQYQLYKQDFPDKVFWTNTLRPNVGRASLSVAKDKSYEEYITAYIEKVMDPIEGDKVMSMTLYPLLGGDDVETQSIQDVHLVDLGKFALACRRADAKMVHFVQTIGFGHINGGVPHHNVTEADIRFQIYCGMAFGSKGFQYFTYASPDTGGEFRASDVAMLSRNNTRTSVYYGVQAVNQEILKFDEVFLNFDWNTTILVDGSRNPEGYSNPGFSWYKSQQDHEMFPLPLATKTSSLKSVKATRDTLVGCMKDGSGNDGYVVVNYTHPENADLNTTGEGGVTDEITMDFSGYRAVVAYIGGEECRFENGSSQFVNGTFTATLNPGEGIFVIPVR